MDNLLAATLLMLVFPKAQSLVLLFFLSFNDLPDNILSKLAINADNTTVYSCLGKTNDVFDKVEMAAELEVDLRTVVEWGDKWLVTFSSSKATVS